MMSIHEVAERLSVSYSVIYRLLRTGALKCHRVGKAARITETQIAEYLSGASNVAPSAPGGLDLTIRCPRCDDELAKHRSENMVHDLTTRYTADCRQCGLRIRYQVASHEALEELAEEVAQESGAELAEQIEGEVAQAVARVDGEGAS
jgi:excisionase family DNA binding protein